MSITSPCWMPSYSLATKPAKRLLKEKPTAKLALFFCDIPQMVIVKLHLRIEMPECVSVS